MSIAFSSSLVYNFSGAIEYTGLDFFLLSFNVPTGIAEIQVDHLLADPSNSTNILDWGVMDSHHVFRGWGGGNVESAIVGIQATSRSYELNYTEGSYLTPGNWSVVVGKPRIATPPGHLSVNITLRDSATLPPQPERRPYVESPPLRTPTELTYYAGDFHVHSCESGDAYASATLDEIANFSKTVAGLDFVHISDHNTVSASSFMVDAQSRHPDILLLPGVEFTTYHGHAGALFTSKFVDFRMGVPGVTIEGSIDQIHAQGGLFSINHYDLYTADPNGDLRNSCVGCEWDLDGSFPASKLNAMEVGIQSYNKSGVFLIPRALEHWDHLHALGHMQVAPIGGSDDHHGGQNPGILGSVIGAPTTMVLAANLSHSAIVEGVRLGRTYIKLNNNSDPNVDFFALCAGSGDKVLLGGTVPIGTESVTLSFEVTQSALASKNPHVAQRTHLRNSERSDRLLQDAGIYSYQLVRNNEITFSDVIPSLPFSFNVTVPAPNGGIDRWRLEVHDQGTSKNLVVLTNHIFIPGV
jgi:hypothetical protein